MSGDRRRRRSGAMMNILEVPSPGAPLLPSSTLGLKGKLTTSSIERWQFRRGARLAVSKGLATTFIAQTREPPPPPPATAKKKERNSRELASAISAVSVGSSHRALLPTPRTDAARRRWSLREDIAAGSWKKKNDAKSVKSERRAKKRNSISPTLHQR